MSQTKFNQKRSRMFLRIGTAFLASTSAFVMANPAFAQTKAEETPVADSDTIVVSATRLARDGFSAPTPTTVVGQEFLEQRAINNIGDALNKVPTFRAAASPSAGGIGNTGAFLADLRGLGPTRTLVLLERGRLPQTIIPGVGASAGTTDLNVIPTVLIRSSDIVTGGASAAYGSDAIAGVVNFQIDDRFTGVKGSVQYGQTRYHDVKDKFATIAGGTSFADGRGHLVAGFEFDDNSGVKYGSQARGYSQQFYRVGSLATRPAGTPFNIIAPNFNYFGTGAAGGLILTPGALQGLAFVPGSNGAVTTAVMARGLGNLTSSFDLFTPEAIAANTTAGIRHQGYVQLRPSSRRYNAMGKLTFDVSDNLSVYVTPMFSRSSNTVRILTRRDGAGAGPGLTLAKDNAYLVSALTPAQLALVPAGGLSVGYIGTDFGAVERFITNELIRVQAGASGDLGGSWKWDVSYLFGQNTSDVSIANNFDNTRFRNALDAVSSNGQVVCRSAAAVSAGCVPINILGKLNASDAARSYFMGTARGTGKTVLNDVAANLQGEPFSTWAGPVSMGVGLEYRKESISLTTDALSQSSGWLSGTGFQLNKVSQDVKEAYAEVIVPLLSKSMLGNKVEFNGAVRATDYSTSGNVKTWKAGLTWELIDGLMFRTTRSRDVRAPNLIELFTPQTPSLPLPTDPRPGIARPSNAPGFVTGGNIALKPEKSVTQTLGVSYQPELIRNLKLSADYYQIRIDGAITSTSTQGVVNNCFVGGTFSGNSFCSLISFTNNDPVAGVITGVRGGTANVAEFKTRGVDFQANYRQPMEDIGLPGVLAVNLLATHVLTYKSSIDVSTLFPNGIDRSGQTGAGFGGPAGLPKWLTNVTVDYEVGGFGINTNLRFVPRSRQNNGLFGPDQAGYNPSLTTSINDNNVPAASYVDVGIRYSFGPDKKYQVYFNVDNLLDRDPPQPSEGSAYYDTFGRTMKGGVRFRF
jgi:iron complex outermembrane receptor protein